MKLRLPNKIHTENVDESEFVRWFNATIVDFSQSFSSGKGSHLLVFIIAGDLQKKNCAQNIQAFLWNFRQNTVCMAMETIHKLISSYKRVFWLMYYAYQLSPIYLDSTHSNAWPNNRVARADKTHKDP